MADFPITTYRLAPREPASRSLVCDQDDAMLGPVVLVFPVSGPGGGRVFQAIAAERLGEILKAAYGPDFDLALAERTSQLQAIARALTENRMADALISAVHLRLPELSEAAVQRLAALAKYSPDQPRVPKGNPGGGQWTREGGAAGPANPLLTPVSATTPVADASPADIEAQHEAARQALLAVFDRSRAEHRSYFGFIYKDRNGSYHATATLTQSDTSKVDWGKARRLFAGDALPEGAKVTAYFVTHYSSVNLDPPRTETFTADEMLLAHSLRVGAYLATPSGKFAYYDGAAGALPTKLGYLK